MPHRFPHTDPFYSLCPRQENALCSKMEFFRSDLPACEQCDCPEGPAPFFLGFAQMEFDEDFISKIRDVYRGFPDNNGISMEQVLDWTLRYGDYYRCIVVRLDCFPREMLLGMSLLSAVIPIKGLKLHSADCLPIDYTGWDMREELGIKLDPDADGSKRPVVYMQTGGEPAPAEGVHILGNGNLPEDIWEDPSMAVFIFQAEKEFDILLTEKKLSAAGEAEHRFFALCNY